MILNLENHKIEILGKDYFIADNATVTGTVTIENNVSIWFNAVVRGDLAPIYIGEGSNIQDCAVLHTDIGVNLTIGKNVTVGHKAILHACTIGENTLIGMNAVVLNNAKIGKNCLIGACALIPEGKIIPDGSLVMGIPGKIVRELTPSEIKKLHESSLHYIETFKKYI